MQNNPEDSFSMFYEKEVLFSGAQRPFSKADHILGHKTSLADIGRWKSFLIFDWTTM